MLSLNYANCLSDTLGSEHGLGDQDLAGLQNRLNDAHHSIRQQSTSGKIGFMDLPHAKEEAKKIMAWAKKAKDQFDTLVVLGIGGSALGNTAIQQALRNPYWNLQDKKERKGALRLFVLDNVDPRWTAELLAMVDPRKTLFNVVSKSGTTAECLANYFIFREALNKKVGPKKAAQHLVFTTDASKGYLRELAQKETITCFTIPTNVGGRFSVLSPVGLLSAALTGIDILELLEGAEIMARRCGDGSLKENPAALYAAIQHLYSLKGKKLSVLMPYSQNLRGMADWVRQLWAESLGKKLDRKGHTVNAGPTPINALGVTDQHSQAQLYMEGPYDKIITFLSVRDFGKKTAIPKVDKTHYLAGKTLNDLLKAEEQATRAALTKALRPNITLTVSEISPLTVGQLFFFFEMAVAYMGELMNVNAFDQPGVELAKVYTYALMGRQGFEAQKTELDALLRKESEGRHVV
jgi:glucose-6-phosphate isomerase